MISECEGI